MLSLNQGVGSALKYSQFRNVKHFSAWINRAKADADTSISSNVDAEKLFIDHDVQSLLSDLTGLDLEKKVFRERRTGYQQRSHFALMTEERLEKTFEKMREEAKHFLQFVPLKEPRPARVEVLSQDSDIEGFDKSKYVFTDITFDATDQDRTVVVREVDGTLRTATPSEHDRMNRTYYEKTNRPVFSPPVFEDPNLQNALERDEHEFVLDWACWFYEPDDPSFVRLSQNVFDKIVDTQKFDVLHSTRHFGPFVFYLALNGNIPPLLNHLGGQGRLRDCANLIRLQKTLHPNWRVTISSSDSDEKIVKDYLKENNRQKDQLKDLTAYLNDGIVKSERKAKKTFNQKKTVTAQTSINANNVDSSEGPLGELSDEYKVNVVKDAEGPTKERRPFKKDTIRKRDPKK
ncbi:unnamed protein product [Auanema sp. JU1783]|nr:unnamed protein product [Auanema sp. JU1783]